MCSSEIEMEPIDRSLLAFSHLFCWVVDYSYRSLSSFVGMTLAMYEVLSDHVIWI